MLSTTQDIAARQWDDIIIGTGMGGATLGHALAKTGRSVLFLERGHSPLARPITLLGDFPERHTLRGDLSSREALIAAGRYPDEIVDISMPQRPRHFTPFIGAGGGGSSALYGMALERFFPQDFQPGANHLSATTAAIPDHWPVSYAELRTHYRAAEGLYKVRGSADPLRPDENNDYRAPPPLSSSNQELFNFFKAQDLHPYQLPLACEFRQSCSTCQSYLCDKHCKNDSASICLRPALQQFDAALLDGCEVERIHANASAVQHIECRRDGQRLQLSAKRYFLAAGALESPRLLLASACEHWPTGIGNQSDLVGRYLMRHYVDLYAVFTRQRPTAGALIKQIALNDFYSAEHGKLGSLQSFGHLPPAQLLANDMQRELRRDKGALAGSLFGLVKPLVRAGLSQVLQRSVILATTLEDLPFAENRVSLANHTDKNSSRLAFQYRPGAGEGSRILSMRKIMAERLRPYRHLLLKQAENNERLAHACGTCRFGDSPDNSVCNNDQRIHGLNNLYVADSSIFPTSGGINPSLTIAALSLRLAKRLTSQGNE